MKDLNEILSLVDKFGTAALRAGQSNSGICIDPSGPSEWKNMQELRTELKEEIENLWERIEAEKVKVIPYYGR